MSFIGFGLLFGSLAAALVAVFWPEDTLEDFMGGWPGTEDDEQWCEIVNALRKLRKG